VNAEADDPDDGTP